MVEYILKNILECPHAQNIQFAQTVLVEHKHSCIVCEPRMTYILDFLSLARLFAKLPLSNFGKGRHRIMPKRLTLIKAAMQSEHLILSLKNVEKYKVQNCQGGVAGFNPL